MRDLAKRSNVGWNRAARAWADQLCFFTGTRSLNGIAWLISNKDVDKQRPTTIVRGTVVASIYQFCQEARKKGTKEEQSTRVLGNPEHEERWRDATWQKLRFDIIIG